MKKDKKLIPFKKAFAIFIIWAMLLSIGGFFLYRYVLKKYIVDKPTVIEFKMPQEDK